MKTEKDRLLGMLGLAKRAGKLVSGTERVAESIRNHAPVIELVLIAENASANSRKRVENCCTYYGAVLKTIPASTEELAHSIGNGGAVSAVGITDKSFTAAVVKIINNTDMGCKAEDKSAGGALNVVKPEIQDQ